MERLSDVEPGFEPQTRARSNTWPLPRPDNYVDEKPGVAQDGFAEAAPKKNSSRRNAWGNMSYADLITQAIQSSPEKRLTLSQIYDWMVQNVPYFKDKGDSNSSAGWKNSIRHNLSLHSRFMRVQNEGAGKSSWWMLNPEAKPGKAARRRATSMETPRYEKKRGRLKKKLEALRASPSPSSSEGPLDPFPESPPPRLELHCGQLGGSSLSGSPSAWPPLAQLDRYGAGPLADTLTQSMTLGDRHEPLGPSQVMGRLLSFNDPLPHDLDLDLDAVQGLHCDVDQVIQHELNVDGNLDFNFDSHRPWVH